MNPHMSALKCQNTTSKKNYSHTKNSFDMKMKVGKIQQKEERILLFPYLIENMEGRYNLPLKSFFDVNS